MVDFEVKTVSFKSDGVACAGRLYLPYNNKQRLACIVLANGFSGTMDWILPDFARRFAEAGFAAFTFDYRHLGESEGTPRQLISLRKQRTDLINAITWARNYDGIDSRRIVLWGTSLGGSHVVAVASTDHQIAATICNMPGIDAFKGANVAAKAKAANASKNQIAMATIQLLGAAFIDVVKNLFGLAPHYLEVYGKPGQAIFTDPSLVERFRTVAEGSASWENRVAARVLFNLPKYKNGTIRRINAPILVTLARNDTELDNDYVKEKFAESENVKVKEYPYDHFSLYHGDAFEQVISDQIRFLMKHVKIRDATSGD
jgi:hypothetical protein